MLANSLPLTLIFMVLATARSKSIDEIIMEAAPNASALDTFQRNPDGEVMIMVDLDIKMDMKQYRELKASDGERRKKRKAWSNPESLWKNGKVYYEIKSNDFNSWEMAVIRGAIEEWETYTCLEFKAASSDTRDKVVFSQGDRGCWSKLGRTGGAQVIQLAYDCVQKGIVIHEIGHTIGWIHEHSRPDRDDYISVNTENIPTKWKDQLEKYSYEAINTFNIPYDYRSIMHYSGKAFPPGTIVTKNQAFQEVIGQRMGLSFRDILLANAMYNCSQKLCGNYFSSSCHAQFGRRKSFAFKMGDGSCACYCLGSDDTAPMVKCTSGWTSNSIPSTTSTTTSTTTTTARPTTTTTAVSSTPNINNMCTDSFPFCPRIAPAFCDTPFVGDLCPKSCHLCISADSGNMRDQPTGNDVTAKAGSERPLSGIGTAVLGPVLFILTWVL